MTAQFVTEGAGEWIGGIHTADNDAYIARLLRRGRRWLRLAGYSTRSDDLAFLAYECWWAMSELHHDGKLDEDYLVAGNVLDQYVTDHDAELLVQAEPEVAASMEGPIGGMTPEVSGVHVVLLRVVGTMRERWSEHEDEA
jgi:hypothetical protein